jgi:Co/Zn/Cd efflux system component
MPARKSPWNLVKEAEFREEIGNHESSKIIKITAIKNLNNLHIWQMTGQRKTFFAVNPPTLLYQM